jgi:hypothetical protein
VYEESPASRAIKNGAPGAIWQPNNDLNDITDKVIKHNYSVNAVSEVLLFTYDPSIGLINSGNFYESNKLYANKIKDENNNDVIEYVDKEGHTICKKVQYGVDTDNNPLYAETYYIYDDFGNLVIVLPPEGVNALLSSTN